MRMKWRITMMLSLNLWVSALATKEHELDANSLNPLDLTLLDENVESDVYRTMDEFKQDVQKIFDNCRAYNAESTNYTRCANRLERYFKERLRVWTNNGDEESDHVVEEGEEEDDEEDEDQDMKEEEN